MVEMKIVLAIEWLQSQSARITMHAPYTPHHDDNDDDRHHHHVIGMAMQLMSTCGAGPVQFGDGINWNCNLHVTKLSQSP